MKIDVVVAFSGGRTSGYMCKYLINNKSSEYNFTFIYANTGQEHENTLKFVNQCDIEFGLNLIWLEAKVIHEEGKGTKHTIVTYETASRNGEPFEEVIKKYGLPNQEFIHCTRELKIKPIKSYVKEMGIKNSLLALGIRADEYHRVKRVENKIYPLVDFIMVTKGDILLWWKTQKFDLEVPEHLGNCKWCYKKSERKLKTLALDYPEVFEFPKRMEENYSFHKSESVTKGRIMFRNNMQVNDIFEASKKPFKKFVEKTYFQSSLFIQDAEDDEECIEECGSLVNEDWH